MEGDTLNEDMEYPVLLIPKSCTQLETDCEATDNIYIELNIVSPDIDGNKTSLYNGLCNVKLIDSYDVNIHEVDCNSQSSDAFDKAPIKVPDYENQTQPNFNQSQVWIDPTRSPYVYNTYDSQEPQDCYSVCQQANTNHITVEQHNTYITQNVYNYNEPTSISLGEDSGRKNFRNIPVEANQQLDTTMYKDDEFECGVFLSQLSEEIQNGQENRTKDDQKAKEVQYDSDALKQLMSTDIQSLNKQQKTILYFGNDSHYGQTIQNIAINDPSLECVDNRFDNDIIIARTKSSKDKKYQCDKCKQIFSQLATFKKHMVSKQRLNLNLGALAEVHYSCTECGKNFKCQDKFEAHCLGHGNPELECNKCHKVFASKFTLRTHLKIHYRKFSCNKCPKTFSSFKEMKSHVTNFHLLFMCNFCNFTCESQKEMKSHRALHRQICFENITSDTDTAATVEEPTSSLPSFDDYRIQEEIGNMQDTVKQADSVIAKIINNELFQLHSKRARRNGKHNKTCEICQKKFDRVSDLKRHLIEHVIKSTLAKTPISKNGTLTIQCEVCQEQIFTKVDKYKAHLREHAKLTIYKCTCCDKSFSDSSNFSKHKKIHGTTTFQCDLCQRKFNSKKMITQHMIYHKNNSPIPCLFCDKVFYFESMLNKHVKFTHTRELSKFRCRFCGTFFKSLKDKWDHEWTVHNVRKIIVDCLMCGAKFRKYSELKRHCHSIHNMEIPLAKKLMKKNYCGDGYFVGF